MTKQKSSFFLPLLFALSSLTIAVATGCNDEKKSSTESTTTDSSTMSAPAPIMDTLSTPVDTNAMDTATTRPIVPGT